jgi:DNA-binding response OmpR family regulator
MPAARVLCVDDEPFILMMVADTMSAMGLTPIPAENGEEALDVAESEAFDLLITDIRLGGIDGWEVAERLRSAQPGLPVIYISGFPTPGKSLPGALYIAKPFRPSELEAAVRTLLSTTEFA